MQPIVLMISVRQCRLPSEQAQYTSMFIWGGGEGAGSNQELTAYVSVFTMDPLALWFFQGGVCRRPTHS